MLIEFLKSFFLLTFFIVIGELYARVEFSSPWVSPYSLSIKDGVVLGTQKTEPLALVKEQLRYLIGFLNERYSGPDFNALDVDIETIRPLSGDSIQIEYQASLAIAVDEEHLNQHAPRAPLPSLGDSEGLSRFLAAFSKNCAWKPSSLASFWYYYRPNKEGCPIEGSDSSLIEWVDYELNKVEASSERVPNFKKIFEDSTLEFTIVMAMEFLNNPSDISIQEFKIICGKYRAVVTEKGEIKECHGEMFEDDIVVKAHVFVLPNLNEAPVQYMSMFAPYIRQSDIVSYNGHAGMGINIKTFLDYFPLTKDKYQIIYMNSCDTYEYFEKSFFNKVNAVNESKSSSSFVDIILNPTPNYFGTFERSNLAIVNGALDRKNFDEILSQFPKEQHSLVLYELNE